MVTRFSPRRPKFIDKKIKGVMVYNLKLNYNLVEIVFSASLDTFLKPQVCLKFIHFFPPIP